MMKPDARLYEVVERQSGGKGGEMLYFDNRPEPVAAGTAHGWQAILRESRQKSLAAVERLGYCSLLVERPSDAQP